MYPESIWITKSFPNPGMYTKNPQISNLRSLLLLKKGQNLHILVYFQAGFTKLPALHIAAPRIPVDPVPQLSIYHVIFSIRVWTPKNTPTNCEMLFDNKQIKTIVCIYIYGYMLVTAGSYHPILKMFFWSKSKSPSSKQHFDSIFFFLANNHPPQKSYGFICLLNKSSWTTVTTVRS